MFALTPETYMLTKMDSVPVDDGDDTERTVHAFGTDKDLTGK